MATFRHVFKRLRARKQRVESAAGELFAMRFKKRAESKQIGAGTLEKWTRTADHFRKTGSGGGNSFGWPQLLTHACMDASGIASSVRSYSA